MNWKLWLHGLAAAAIGGASTTSLQVLTATGTINGRQLGVSAGVGALGMALAYLIKSPIAPAVPAADPPVEEKPIGLGLPKPGLPVKPE
jgi:hypothetical protein